MSRRRILATGAALSCVDVSPGVNGAEPNAVFSLERVAAIEAAADGAVRTGDVPGAISIVWHRGEVVSAYSVGLRDVENRLPVERSTIFGIASMTKPITVALALTLVEDGALALDAPIASWVPELAHMRVLRRADGPLDETYVAPRAITVEDLMTHRAGFGYGFLSPGPLGAALSERFGLGIESTLTPDAWLENLAALPLAHAPGERFTYGHSIDVLGFVAARAAGTSLRQALQTRLFEPLGMVDTDFWVPPEKRNRLAAIYLSPARGEFVRVPLGSFTAQRAPAYTAGGQGLLSTVDDYLRFARMLLARGAIHGTRVLKPETVALMTRNRLTDAQRQQPFMGQPFFDAQGFGLGVSVVLDATRFGGAASNGSYGWPGGFGGWWQADPEQDLALVWLQQCVPAPPVPGAVASLRVPGALGTLEFQQRTYAALQG